MPELAHCCDGFPEDALQRLTLSSSLIYLRAASRKDFGLMQAWSAHFADNIARHHMLPHWEELSWNCPTVKKSWRSAARGLQARAGILEREHARMQAEDLPRLERRPAQEIYEQAVNALLENDVLAGQEMRHQASLSPIALLRSWKVDLAVDCGRMRHSLRGEATAYGRGLSLAAARASYAMEIVERASSYVSVARTGEHTFEVTNRRRPMPLVHASCAKLRSQGKDFLPLSSLPLETPFEDYVPLYWLEARDPEGKAVLVPAQAVFCSAIWTSSPVLASGSTGLASGNTEAEARLAALTEIVERDAEATTPFSREGCFVLKSRDERLQALLDDYAARGIQIQFQDITTELGVPVYRCFVMSRRGEVAQATGANLCGSRAALAALTEVLLALVANRRGPLWVFRRCAGWKICPTTVCRRPKPPASCWKRRCAPRAVRPCMWTSPPRIWTCLWCVPWSPVWNSPPTSTASPAPRCAFWPVTIGPLAEVGI